MQLPPPLPLCLPLPLSARQPPAMAEELRRGPWTVEEDLLLGNFVAEHGEGRWNSLARRAGLKRTGKSCRLRWLNYLRPDVRLGNITPEEQLLILELHSRWGNRWSKIAQFLPGRTDNEIKNYWRTRVQKHAKQLRCDVDSAVFRDSMLYVWMPRLLERVRAAASGHRAPASAPPPPQAAPCLGAEDSGAPASEFCLPFADCSPSAALTQGPAGEIIHGRGGDGLTFESVNFPIGHDDELGGSWAADELLVGGDIWSTEDKYNWCMQ